MSALNQIVDQMTAATLEWSSAMRAAVKRIHELETGLNRMICAHENTLAESDGVFPSKDAHCSDCTEGATPHQFDSGPCAYHAGKRLLGQL
jgi:hypothetical protein